MPFAEIVRVALESIRANFMRAALTMLGVIIGVAAVITMVALGSGAQKAIDQQLQSLGANLLTINTGMWFMRGVSRQQNTLTIDDAEALGREAVHLTAVVPEMSIRDQVKSGNRNINVSITGTTPNFADVQGFTLAAGRMFGGADDAARRRVIVVGAEVPGMLDTDAAALVGQTLQVRAVPFEVIGVFEAKGAVGMSNPDDDVWIPLQTARHRLTGEDTLQSISVEVAPSSTIEQAMVDIERILRRAHGILPGRDNDFAIFDRKTFFNARAEATEIFSYLLASIAGVSLVVGGIGIMNIMLVTVTERTREIGIRKAMGARRTTILLQFLVESVTLCALGGVLGIALGAGLSMLLGGGPAVRAHAGTACRAARPDRGAALRVNLRDGRRPSRSRAVTS
ncbi:MAG: putative macrolide efflux transporter, permease protein [Proteobacteria bacterium]|nr:putative macrolide efflux transporter, permease protein [Pseudomonadota bacterium]